jgi:hypothetical protein
MILGLVESVRFAQPVGWRGAQRYPSFWQINDAYRYAPQHPTQILFIFKLKIISLIHTRPFLQNVWMNYFQTLIRNLL